LIVRTSSLKEQLSSIMATVEDVARIRDAMHGKAVPVLSHRQREELAVAAATAGKDGDAAAAKLDKELQEPLKRGQWNTEEALEYVQKKFLDAVVDYIPTGGEGATAAIGAAAQHRKLRSHDNLPQRLANAMANLKAAAVNLNTAVATKDTKRTASLLEKAYTNYSALADHLAEEGVLTLEDKTARDQEAWSVYEEATEANDQFLANKAQESHKEKLKALTADLKGAKDMLLSKVQTLNN
jgi:hypothetical protein